MSVPAGYSRLKPLLQERGETTPRLYLHVAIELSSGDVLGDECFRVQSIQGSEEVGSPFHFQVTMSANTDADGDINLNFSDLMGCPVSLGIEQPTTQAMDNSSGMALGDRFRNSVEKGDSDPPANISFFNGIITRFGMQQPGVYQMTVSPSIHRLSLTNQYRLHAGKTIREIIEELMARHGIDYSIVPIQESANSANFRRQDWLQAGESDYEFLQRLLAKVHIHYYFIHSPASHTVVFSNKASYPPVFRDERVMRYTYTEDLGCLEDDQVLHYGYEENLQSSGVNTVFTRQQEAWEVDQVAGEESYPAESDKGPGDLPFNLYKIYQYGGSAPEAEGYTRQVQDCLNTSRTSLNGASRSPAFRSGHTFSMRPVEGNDGGESGVWPNPVRPSLKDRVYVLTKVEHNASQSGEYSNQFNATEAEGLITPFNLQATHQGSILATVVDSKGNDNHGDWRFYQRRVFDPDIGQYMDEAPSSGERLHAKGVYVRFSTEDSKGDPIWVKLAAHMQTAPEIGAQVMVGRSNDDSELPEVQGIVQANGSYTVTPCGWTSNTQVGNNYSTSYGDRVSLQYPRQGPGSGGNGPLDFDAAKKKSLKAYESGKYRDASYSEGGSFSYSTAVGGRTGLLSESYSYGSNYNWHYGEHSNSVSEVDHHYSHSWTGDSEDHSTVERTTYSNSWVKGSTTSISRVGESRSTNKVDGDTSSNSTVGGDSTSESVNMGNVTGANAILGDHVNANLVAGNSLSSSLSTNSVSAGVQIGVGFSTNLHVGSNTNMHTMMGESTTVSMNLGDSQSINVNAGNSTSAQINTVSENASMTGVSSSMSMTGVHSGMNLVGVSSDMSVSGISSHMNVVGVQSNINVTGLSSAINVHGQSLTVDVGPTGMNVNINPAGIECNVIAVKVQLPTGIMLIV